MKVKSIKSRLNKLISWNSQWYGSKKPVICLKKNTITHKSLGTPMIPHKIKCIIKKLTNLNKSATSTHRDSKRSTIDNHLWFVRFVMRCRFRSSFLKKLKIRAQRWFRRCRKKAKTEVRGDVDCEGQMLGDPKESRWYVEAMDRIEKFRSNIDIDASTSSPWQKARCRAQEFNWIIHIV